MVAHPAVSSLEACTTPARMSQWPYCILDKGQASYNPKQKQTSISRRPDASYGPAESQLDLEIANGT